MSSSSPNPRPGPTGQTVARATFCALGILITGAALVLLVLGGVDFFSPFETAGRPTKFWMFFIGLPLLGLGVWCLKAGFLGVGARYVVGETAPARRGAAAYLTDGRGQLSTDGLHCRSCGTRNDPAARFCPSCGTATA